MYFEISIYIILTLSGTCRFTLYNLSPKHPLLMSQLVRAVSARSHSAFAPSIWPIKESIAFIGEKEKKWLKNRSWCILFWFSLWISFKGRLNDQSYMFCHFVLFDISSMLKKFITWQKCIFHNLFLLHGDKEIRKRFLKLALSDLLFSSICWSIFSNLQHSYISFYHL